jgi:tyrosine-protein kinase Etk/Wzc
MTDPDITSSFDTPREEKNIDVRQLFMRILANWPIVLACILFAAGGAWLYLKKSPRIYEGSATILVRDTKSKAIDAQGLIGLDMLRSSSTVENEQQILQSVSLTYSAVKKLQWRVSYFSDGHLRDNPLYNSTPFIIEPDTTHTQRIGVRFDIEFSGDNTWHITSKGGGSLYNYSTNEFGSNEAAAYTGSDVYDGKHHFGDTISSGGFRFVLVKGPGYNEPGEGAHYYFYMNSLQGLGKSLNAGLTTEPTSKTATVLHVTMRYNEPGLLNDFLNALAEEYLQYGLNSKNEVALRTIEFIDGELDGISTQLANAEGDLEKYRHDNKIIKLDDEATRVFDYMKQLDNEKAILMLKSKYYKYLKDYLEAGQDPSSIIVPSAMGIDDPVTAELITGMAKLYDERSALAKSAGERNPAIQQLDAQLQQTRNSILENIKNIINLSNLSINDINARSSMVDNRISGLPTNQRKLLGFEREFELYNQLYVFLLQRKAEAQITAATNMPDNYIIDPCRSDYVSLVSPNSMTIYSIALLIGLLLALGIIFGPDFLRNTFSSPQEIEEAVGVPMAGFIIHNEYKDENIFINHSSSPLAEGFRSLRTNFNFIGQTKDKMVILVTSDLPKAGKTFISYNVGHTYAMSGRKTLLVAADMRKSQIHEIFSIPSKPGLSNLLIGACTLQQAVYKTTVPNLFVMPAGVVPPNPAELLDSENCENLFKQLRQEYDLIIIDTPPAGLVTDANILMPYADINALIIRMNVTRKSHAKSLIADLKRRKVPHPVVIVNDVKVKRRFGYGYRYGYGYGYGYSEEYFKEGEDKIDSKV